MADVPIVVVGLKLSQFHVGFRGEIDGLGVQHAIAIGEMVHQSMIPKSGYRFSEKIMLHQKPRAG